MPPTRLPRTEPGVFRVVTTGAPPRRVFEGTEADAEEHIRNHYPRVHIEPGTDYPDGPVPDVVLQSPNGTYRGWNGSDWSEWGVDEQGWFPAASHDEPALAATPPPDDGVPNVPPGEPADSTPTDSAPTTPPVKSAGRTRKVD